MGTPCAFLRVGGVSCSCLLAPHKKPVYGDNKAREITSTWRWVNATVTSHVIIQPTRCTLVILYFSIHPTVRNATHLGWFYLMDLTRYICWLLDRRVTSSGEGRSTLPSNRPTRPINDGSETAIVKQAFGAQRAENPFKRFVASSGRGLREGAPGPKWVTTPHARTRRLQRTILPTVRFRGSPDHGIRVYHELSASQNGIDDGYPANEQSNQPRTRDPDPRWLGTKEDLSSLLGHRRPTAAVANSPARGFLSAASDTGRAWVRR
ncbi:hypothetical protein FB451DRAFT_1174937 [Mycena latifolia]|nr:hypothetical protein FB451DRAFT_1174937 [Mycena latifolia]